MGDIHTILIVIPTISQPDWGRLKPVLQCPFYVWVMASIVDSKVSENWQRKKNDGIRRDSETIAQLFNWDFWHISLTKSVSRPFFPFHPSS